MLNGIYYEAPWGVLTLWEESGALVKLSFGRDAVAITPEQERETPLLREAKTQLSQYFAGQRMTFDLPLLMKGTPFQKEVWRGLLKIPYGETRSYSEIAAAIGRPKAVRAVGMANHCNPLAIIVPCHRVIGKNGSLTGYAGSLEIKRRLLALEKSHF